MSLLHGGARCAFLSAVSAAGLAACGGGGGSASAGPVVTPTPAPGFVLPTPGPARSYSGTRTIVVTGTPLPGWPGTATYTVAGTEQDVTPGSGAPSGAALERHTSRTFTGAPPAAGIFLQSEQRVDYVAFSSSGIVLLSTSDAVTGRDLDAERSTPSTQFTDTNAAATTYAANALIAPAVPVSTALPFPLGATLHLTDQSIGTSGVALGATSRKIDYTRVTNGDGSFDETGRFSDVGDHAIHQHADGSATSHDQLPGFFLRDVTVSAPSGSTLAVTTQTQGRTVGNPPIVTSSYSTPVWYAPGALASATLFVTPNSSLSECGLSSPQRALALNLARTHVDVTSGVRFVENDTAYVDASGLIVCRDTSDVIGVSDVTTGASTGVLDDRTIVRYTGLAPSPQARARATKTR